MAFLNPQVIKRIELPDQSGEWIEIRTVLTQGIRQRAAAAGMRMSLVEADRVVDFFGYRQQLLKDIIVGWSDPSPLTPQAVEDLPPDIADFVAGEFETLNAGRDEEGKNPSGASSPNGPAPTPVNAEASGPESSLT